MRNAPFHFILIMALLVLGSSCARPPLPVERRAPLSPAQLLARLQTRTSFWNDYQAKLQIRAESAKGKFRFRSVIVAQLPHAFRLETFNPFGQTIGVLVFNQGTSTLYIPAEKVVYTASRTEQLIKYFLGVPVPLELFAYSLAACVPPEQLDHLHVAAEDSGWTANVREPVSGRTLNWQFNSEPAALRQIAIEGALEDYTISFEPSARLDLQDIPNKILFSGAQWQMEVTVSEMKTVFSLQPSIFNLPIPQGTRVIDLDVAG